MTFPIKVSYPEPIQQGLFGRETTLLSPIIFNTKPHADLIVENESPDQTKDQLQVPTHNVTTACVCVCVCVCVD